MKRHLAAPDADALIALFEQAVGKKLSAEGRKTSRVAFAEHDGKSWLEYPAPEEDRT
jgi:hypothetical protein